MNTTHIMQIIEKIKDWWYRLRFRFMMWKLNRAMSKFSRSIGAALIPAIKTAITAFSALDETTQKSEEK